MILHDDDVLLRPWKIEDATWYVQVRDEEIFKWTTERRELTVTEAERAIRRVNENPDVFSFAIVDCRTNELVGNIALVRDRQNPRTCELMYWLAPEGRGRGFATKAGGLLCRAAFERLGFESITLKTYAGNVRSQQVAERIGFQRCEPEGEGDSEVVWFTLTEQQMRVG